MAALRVRRAFICSVTVCGTTGTPSGMASQENRCELRRSFSVTLRAAPRLLREDARTGEEEPWPMLPKRSWKGSARMCALVEQARVLVKEVIPAASEKVH